MKKLMRGVSLVTIAAVMLFSNICSVNAAPWGGHDNGQRNGRQPNDNNYNKTNYSSVVLKSSTPANKGTLSTSDETITLKFSGNITYDSSQDGSEILLIKDSKKGIPITIEAASSSSLVITPDSDLSENSEYKLYVNGLRDSDDMAIKPFTLSFNTENDSSDTDEDNDTDSNGSKFSDVDKDFWAYDAITDLSDRGIIKGYSDKTFKPNATVTRSEFASMLTKALGLTASSSTQTFTDVDESSWDYSAVEAAKDYMTGYKTSSGTMYFYGDKDAVREDMAVALVKALGLTLVSSNTALQQLYTDYSSISANLRDYVYTAYENGIMLGSDNKFNPQSSLTRAEAASLLERAMQKTEKVIVDDSSDSSTEKVVVDGTTVSSSISTDAELRTLRVNGTTISGFDSDIYTYNVKLAAATTVVPTVSASVYDTYGATASVTQASDLPGYATIVVTAEDGSTTRTYTIYFTVEDESNTDATLSNLTVNGATVSGFDSDICTYKVKLASGTTIVPTVVATVNDTGDANVVVVPAAGLPGTTTIIVTAEDGTTIGIYTISFTVSEG